jgi:anti-anti-sigma factor
MTMISFRADHVPQPFHAELEQRGETTVVVASGEIDLASADRLEACLHEARARSGRVVLDLRRVDFIDCAGLRRILHFRDSVRDFALIPGPGQVQRLFLLTSTFGELRFIDPGEIASSD